jgi:hypothetical protein
VPFEAMVHGSALSESAGDVQAPSDADAHSPFSTWEPTRCNPALADSAKVHGSLPGCVGALHIVAENLIRASVSSSESDGNDGNGAR